MKHEQSAADRTPGGAKFKPGGIQLTLQHQRRFGGCECGTGDGASSSGVQAEKQQRYAQLIAQGVKNSEACRLVGVDRKTGNRWRYGRTVRNSAGASCTIRR